MRVLSISLLLLCQISLSAQSVFDIKPNMLNQLTAFPQEKVYIHTDKPSYVSGEMIWYRIYLTDAALHMPTMAQSRYVYVDLIDPMGQILSHSMIRPDEDDCYHNRIALDGDLPEGFYMIRGYTRYMLNRPGYLFEKKVFISDPQSHVADVRVAFSKAGGIQGKALICFTDKNGNPVQVDKFSVGVDSTYNLPVDSNGDGIHFNIIPNRLQTLYIAFEYKNRVHRKYISIPDLNDDFEVSFHPEGGYILADAENVIGFKAINVKGLAEPIVVELLDTNGDLVRTVQSNAMGMGKFTFYASAGQSYVAVCTNARNISRRVHLPESRSDVYNLHTAWEGDNLEITPRSCLQKNHEPLWLLLHVRGMVVSAGAVQPNAKMVFKKDLFPSGVVHILLLDTLLNPLSERLVFCLNNDQAVASIRSDQINYAKRDRVSIDVDIVDGEGTPLSGNYSVSVTDNRDVSPEKDVTIGSVLLLASDLKGYIEFPGYYFEENQDRSADLDALLLTQGWRRYHIPETLKGEIETPALQPQCSQEISGFLRKVDSGKPVPNESIVLFVPQFGFYFETTSDANGRFIFDDIELPDSTRCILLASAAMGQRTELIVDTPPIIPMFPFAPPPHFSEALFALFASGARSDYLQKADTKYAMEEGLRTVELSPVMVTASRTTSAKVETPSLFTSMYTTGTGKVITTKVIEEEVFRTNNIMSLLLSNVPGLDYSEGEFGLPTFYFPRVTDSFLNMASSQHPARIYVDNILMDSGFDVRSIPLTAIASVEAMPRPTNAMFGTDGTMGGAILIMTKNGEEHIIRNVTGNTSLKTVIPVGYKRDVEFYAPKYDAQEVLSLARPDLRTTIYWKPNNIFVSGKSTIHFYAADAKTTYSIVVEGIADDGKIFRQVQIINIAR